MAGTSNRSPAEYKKKFLDAVDFAFKKCSVAFKARKEQQQAIFAAVTGKDVFVKAATGFGKSVCYLAITYVCDYLYSCQTDATNFNSVLLLISPLKALMDDQMRQMIKYGITLPEVTHRSY